jgi:hypothetical protein
LSLEFVEKIKESAVSVVPVMALVILLHLTITPLDSGSVVNFLVGGVLLILGLAVFLVGAELGMVAFGQKVGGALAHQRSLLKILASAFVIGFAITIAEPDVQVLAIQIQSVAPEISKNLLVFFIGLGVGLFLVLGTIRIILRLSLRWLLLIFYLIVFGVCAFVETGFTGMAFDSGGATTGPITVPFIMAMGIGVSAAAMKVDQNANSFGMVGLASIGPVLAVAVMGLFMTNLNVSEAAEETVAADPTSVAVFLELLPHTVYDIFMALFPLTLIVLFFQFALLKLSAHQLRRMLLGMFYAMVGMILFMLGVNGGFSAAGETVGGALGALGSGVAVIPIGLVFGAVVVCAEPAVWVLTQQVEEVSGGYIKRSIMLAALSISIALAVGVGMTRVFTGVSIWYALIPGYLLAFVLMKFSPPMFTAIAFDSGGVASGPMSTTFVLSMTLGASKSLGGNPVTDAFGMVAMIAMAPLITIQILGCIFKIKEKKAKERQNTEVSDAGV